MVGSWYLPLNLIQNLSFASLVKVISNPCLCRFVSAGSTPFPWYKYILHMFIAGTFQDYLHHIVGTEHWTAFKHLEIYAFIWTTFSNTFLSDINLIWNKHHYLWLNGDSFEELLVNFEIEYNDLYIAELDHRSKEDSKPKIHFWHALGPF